MSAIPEGFSTLTPTLMVEGAAKAIELYTKAFGAKEQYRMEKDDGKIMHACITIGNSKVFLGDSDPHCGGPSTSSFYVYLENVDNAYQQATGAGLQGMFPPQDMFWGDRMGSLKDSFGITWTLATHVRDISPEEMEKGRKEWEKTMAAHTA